jgi:hypothetical protein
MGQTTGDCAIRDQHTTPATPTEQHPVGFHAELHTLDRAQLLPPSGTKPAECPSLPALATGEQQSNRNAIRPAGGNSILSTYENLDLDVRGLPGQFPINGLQTNANAIRPFEGNYPSKGNAISSTYESLDLDVRSLPDQFPIHEPQSNSNAMRPEGSPAKGNAIYSTYESLDLEVPPQSTAVPPPDENQNQSQLLNRIKAIAKSSQ